MINACFSMIKLGVGLKSHNAALSISRGDRHQATRSSSARCLYRGGSENDIGTCEDATAQPTARAGNRPVTLTDITKINTTNDDDTSDL